MPWVRSSSYRACLRNAWLFIRWSRKGDVHAFVMSLLGYIYCQEQYDRTRFVSLTGHASSVYPMLVKGEIHGVIESDSLRLERLGPKEYRACFTIKEKNEGEEGEA